MKKLLLFLFFTLTHSAIALDKKYFETQMEEPLTQESLSFPSTIVDTSVWRSKDLSEPDMTKAMRLKKIVSSHITGAFCPTYFEDLTKFALYLEENAESILKNKPSLYIHSDGWLRTPLLLYKDKSIYIIFKKMYRPGTSISKAKVKSSTA